MSGAGVNHGTVFGQPGRRPNGMPAPGHGTRLSYVRGCRCGMCRSAQAAYRQDLKILHGRPDRRCEDCDSLIVRSKQRLCPDCRPVPVRPVPAPLKPCAGGCGKQMVVAPTSRPHPKCNSCRTRDRPPITCCVCGELMGKKYHLHPEARPQGEAVHKRCQPPVTHCPQGHEYTEENTRFKGARRCCRRCELEYQAQYVADGRRPKMRGHSSWRKTSVLDLQRADRLRTAVA